MPALAVTAIGADQPGIVAAVTGVLVEHGCNLEDTSMSILGGHFAMVMIVDVTADVTALDLERDLAATAPLELVVAVRAVTPQPVVADSESVAGWTVVVYGADHPGIVYGFTQRLAKLGVNIVDLKTRVTSETPPPIYVMVMEGNAARGTAQTLRLNLVTAAGELGVSARSIPSGADIL